MAIKNDTGDFVSIMCKDTGRGVCIAPGKQRVVESWQGPMLVVGRTNAWRFPMIPYRAHPEATKNIFRFGICSAGFGYVRTYCTLRPGGVLTVGNGRYEAEYQTEW